MKRDMELVRHILLTIEEMEPGRVHRTIELDGDRWNQETQVDHLLLVFNSGLIAGNLKTMGGDRTLLLAIEGLTWEGHDLLDSIRDDSVWSAVKAKLATVGGGASIEVMKSLATSYIKRKLGIEGG